MCPLRGNMVGKINKVKLTVSGRVQMVGFRYFTVKAASRTGLKGYVKNLPSGKVEIVACGEKLNLKKFIEAVKEGPPAAEVRGVKADWTYPAGEEFKDFTVRY